MDELYELVKAFNRLKDRIIELIAKIDLLLKSSVDLQTEKDAQPCVSTDGYVEEEGACRILRVSPRTLAYLRAAGSIPFIKNGKKIQYLVTDLNEYMDRSKTRKKELRI